MSKPMPMHGGPKGMPGGPGMQPRKLDKKTLKRLLSYLKNYKGTIVLVTICILLSAVAGAASSMFLQTLIDDYITPMVGQSSPDFSGFIRALITMAVIYLIGTLSTLIYNRRMVTIAQGTLKTIRDEMFEKMQRLPIRYFDSHTHGDTMSLYTNDTDTLRQMLAQSMGQLISSAFTVAAVFCCMLYISVGLTLVVCISLFFIMQIIKKVIGKSGAYFVAQQRSLADLDGYIEEMINGQKVIKVFCHEEQSKKEMKQRNTEWEHNAANANGHATSMMPMTNAFGYFLYILLAVIGSYMAIAGTKNFGLTGVNTLSLGMIASFLVLSRNFINPISQMSNQFNSIVNALAGAERIFTFMDEEPEPDDGYVTLVNAKEENGEIVEVKEHTGMWAWKHPHGDGTLTYTKLEGQVVLDHVDFGYTPEKEVLHDITLYAEPGQKVAFVGATGAGKTTVSDYLRENGVTVIDADQVARRVVEQGSACIADIALEFGCEYINMDGTLNRRKMARTVFGDKAKLKKLNSLMFPYIIEEIRGELARLKEEQGGLIVLDAPTLFESRADDFCDLIVSVVADEEIRKKRIMQRDSIPEGAALQRMEMQLPESFFRSHSDTVLENNWEPSGTLRFGAGTGDENDLLL